jgi:hypothetical protein
MSLQFGFVIFWPKDFGAKAAHKMLVKLTPDGTESPGLDTQFLEFSSIGFIKTAAHQNLNSSILNL